MKDATKRIIAIIIIGITLSVTVYMIGYRQGEIKGKFEHNKELISNIEEKLQKIGEKFNEYEEIYRALQSTTESVIQKINDMVNTVSDLDNNVNRLYNLWSGE
jgi:predicted hydrocarbon binding protein